MKQNALRAKDAQLKVNLPIGQREDALGHAERKLLLRSPLARGDCALRNLFYRCMKPLLAI